MEEAAYMAPQQKDPSYKQSCAWKSHANVERGRSDSACRASGWSEKTPERYRMLLSISGQGRKGILFKEPKGRRAQAMLWH